MRLDYQLLLKSPPLDLLAGSAPTNTVFGVANYSLQFVFT